MIEKVVCCCGNHDNGQKDIEMSVNDDFKIIYQFTDDRFNPPVLVPLMAFDLKIDFYVKGRSTTYTVSKSGLTGTNCLIDNRASSIKCLMQNHNLGTGYLYAKISIMIPDTDYPAGYRTEVSDTYTGIKLV